MGQALRTQSIPIHEPHSVWVKEAETAEEMDAVYRLVHDTFVERGIIHPQSDGRLANYPELDRSPNTTVFVAYQNHEVVGTISFTVGHGPEEVYNFSLFQEELRGQVRPGEPVFSGWRFASNAHFRIRPLVVFKLMQAVHKHSFKLNVRTSFFSFVAEHKNFYCKLFPSGELLARKNKVTELVDADLYLMRYWTDFAVYDDFQRRIDQMSQPKEMVPIRAA